MGSNRKSSSGEKDFFRENQSSWATLDVVNDHPPFISQVGIIFLFLFMVAFTFYSAFTNVPIVVEGPGKIVSETPPVPIRASATFTVSEILVKENQRVNKGHVLVKSQENLDGQALAKLNLFLAGVRRINFRPPQDLCLDCEKLIADLSNLYLSIRTHGEILSLISPLNDHLRELRRNIELYRDLKKMLAPQRHQIGTLKSKLAKIRAQRAEIALAKEVEEIQSTIISLQAQVDEKYRSVSSGIKDIRSQLKARTKEIEDRISQFGRSFSVTAPFAGVVSNIKVKGPGELVASGQHLMEIVPEKTKLIAVVDVMNRDISKIKPGDKVIVAVDSLPELDYGTLDGTIKDIVRTQAADQGASEASLDRLYTIQVLLESQFLGQGRARKDLMLGMSLRGRVVTGHESLGKAIYRGLFRVKEDLKVSR